MDRVLRKIAIEIVLIPGVKTWCQKIVQFYDIAQVEKELDMFNRKPKVGLLNFRHYLPDTEARIERLRRVINKRPAAIILHGPSVTELEARITELEDCDICYFSTNESWVPEKHILQKIGRNLSVILGSGIPITQVIENSDFLERPEDNIFISAKESFNPRKKTIPQGFHLDQFIKKYDKKLLFFTSAFTVMTADRGLHLQVPSIGHPLHFPRLNSFSLLLSLAVIGGASRVVVFGGDGGRIGTGELHFRQSDQEHPDLTPEHIIEQALMDDTRAFNVTMPLILERIYEIYNLKPIDIINCSEQSHYTPFRKLSYDETFALLKSEKKGEQLENGKPEYTVHHR